MVFVAAVFVLRAAYLIWLCPYDLAADEAQYWDWSRRLDLSYYSKGPGVAWAIAAGTHLLGSAEWAIRLPAALAAALAALAVGGMARAVSGGNTRAGLIGAALFCLAPVFHGTAQFMTIDSPFFMCWALATWVGWLLLHQPWTGTARLAGWCLLGVIVGAGFLCKYTMVLWIPGFAAYLALRRRGAAAPPRRAIDLALGLLACAGTVSPVFVWNAQHGWPTVAHLLGQAKLPGGDLQAHTHWHYNPLWTLGYLATPLLVLGPPVAILIAVALIRAWRNRTAAPAGWAGARYALCCAAPVLLLYLVASLTTDVELNWPVAGYIVLLAPAAYGLVTASSRLMRRLWHASVAFGIAACLVISMGPAVAPALTWLGGPAARRPLERLLARVSGNRAFGRAVTDAAARLRAEQGQEPLLIASKYGTAALIAYYGAGRPRVCSASSFLTGGRESSYDYFPDTDLCAPALRGRTALLVGADLPTWRARLGFEQIEPAPEKVGFFVGTGYKGPLVPRRRR